MKSTVVKEDERISRVLKVARERASGPIRPSDILASILVVGEAQLLAVLGQALIPGASLGDLSELINVYNPGAPGPVVLDGDEFDYSSEVQKALAGFAVALSGIGAAGALVGLFFFYLSFEFTIVSSIPLMTELLPSARATLMAFNVAAMSLGRAMGAFLAPRLYGLGFLMVALGAIVFNLLALLAVSRLKKTQASYGSSQEIE